MLEPSSMRKALRSVMKGLAKTGVALLCLGIVSGYGGDRSVVIEGVPEPVRPPSQPPSDTLPLATSPLQTENAAGLHVDILPGTALPLGTDVVFRVTSHKPGYLLIVDINADKQVTQIYPNVMSLIRKKGKTEITNLVQADATVEVPDVKNPLARFTFRTEPPLGRGIIVAVLSAQPVQLIDLPELPSLDMANQTTVDFLDSAIKSLKVAQVDKPNQFDLDTWSFAAVEYVIR